MRKIFTYLLIAIVVFGYFGLSAYSDYTWDKKYLQQKTEDWIVYSIQANFIDPIHPYTIIKQPVSRLGLIDKAALKEIKDNVYFIKMLWVDKEFGGGEIKEETFRYLLDCENYRTGWGSGGKNIGEGNIDLSSIEWSGVSESDEAYRVYKEECGVVESFLFSGTYESVRID